MSVKCYRYVLSVTAAETKIHIELNVIFIIHSFQCTKSVEFRVVVMVQHSMGIFELQINKSNAKTRLNMWIWTIILRSKNSFFFHSHLCFVYSWAYFRCDRHSMDESEIPTDKNSFVVTFFIFCIVKNAEMAKIVNDFISSHSIAKKKRNWNFKWVQKKIDNHLTSFKWILKFLLIPFRSICSVKIQKIKPHSEIKVNLLTIFK